LTSTVLSILNITIPWDDTMQSARNLSVFWRNFSLNLQGRRASHIQTTGYTHSNSRIVQRPMAHGGSKEQGKNILGSGDEENVLTFFPKTLWPRSPLVTPRSNCLICSHVLS
jgi:hypothetical protein